MNSGFFTKQRLILVGNGWKTAHSWGQYNDVLAILIVLIYNLSYVISILYVWEVRAGTKQPSMVPGISPLSVVPAELICINSTRYDYQ